MPATSMILLRQQVMHTLYAPMGQLYGTATGGSASTVVDTKLITTILGTDHYVGSWVYIASDAGGAAAAPEEECRRITSFTPGTGTLTVNPDFTAAVAASDTYEVHPWLHPTRLNEAINRALEMGSQRAYAAITDFDLATSPIYDQDLVIEGALFFANVALLRRILRGQSGPSFERVMDEVDRHYRRWYRGGTRRLGYNLPGKGYFPTAIEIDQEVSA